MGVTLTATGLVAAVSTSVWLAIQPGTLLTDSIQVPLMIAAFVVSFGLMVSGAYLVVTAARANTAPAEMETPLRLADYLRGRGTVLLDDAAVGLDADVVDVLHAFEELTRLKLFAGFCQRPQRLVCAVDAPILAQMQRCAICGQPIQLVREYSQCHACQTEYYLPQS
jgi:hypothetical protein